MKKEERLNSREKKINDIIDAVMVIEGYKSYDEVDSLTAMTIIADIEDHFDINLDLNILEGVTERTALVERLMDEMTIGHAEGRS